MFQQIQNRVAQIAKAFDISMEEAWQKLHSWIDRELGIGGAEVHDTLSSVHADVGAVEHNVGDVVKDSTAAVADEVRETQKQVDGVVDAVEGVPAPHAAPLTPQTPVAEPDASSAVLEGAVEPHAQA